MLCFLLNRGRPWGPGGASPRFRGRGFGPSGPMGPSMRRGGGANGGGGPFFRGRGGAGPPRFGNPNYGGDPGWGPPMYGPPPGMGYGNQMELWVETKTEDSKSYFYHAMTRETTWTRPEGPHIKIMSQAEVEGMNATKNQQQSHQQMPPQQQQQIPAQNNSAEHIEDGATTGIEAKPENGQTGSEENIVAPSTDSPLVDTSQQPKIDNADNVNAHSVNGPAHFTVVPQQQQIPPQIPPQMTSPFTSPPPFVAPQYGMPPPGFGGFPPGPWPMPWQHQPVCTNPLAFFGIYTTTFSIILINPNYLINSQHNRLNQNRSLPSLESSSQR